MKISELQVIEAIQGVKKSVVSRAYVPTCSAALRCTVRQIRISYYINSNGAEIFKNNYPGRDPKTSREILTMLMFG
jgi:hypothetical protein